VEVGRTVAVAVGVLVGTSDGVSDTNTTA